MKSFRLLLLSCLTLANSTNSTWADALYYTDWFSTEVFGSPGSGNGLLYPVTYLDTFYRLYQVNAMTVDLSGNVYASCHFNSGYGVSEASDYISRSTYTENSVLVMGIGGTALACDPAGNLYSLGSDSTVTKISTNRQISSYVNCPGAVAIAFDQKTNLFYVTGQSVWIFVSDGSSRLLGNLTGNAVAQALAVDTAGNAYVSTSAGIEKISFSGSNSLFLSWTNVPSTGIGGGTFESPAPGLCIDTNGNLFFHFNFASTHSDLAIGRVSLSSPANSVTNYIALAGFYGGTIAYSPFAPVPGPIPAIPAFIQQQPLSTTNDSVGSAAFTVVADGTTPLNYQWFFNGTNILGATNSTLILTNIGSTNVGSYHAIVSNPGTSITSSNATLFLVLPPTITIQPQNQIAHVGDAVSFTVQDVSITRESYQWLFNSTNIIGANSSTYTIQTAKQKDLGDYSVIVSNSIGGTPSSVATLQMYPFLFSPFAGVVAIWGRDASLSVSPGGTGPFTYEWLMNGVAIDDATNQTLIVSSIQFTNVGLYSVVVTSPFGSVTNAPAQVVVNPAGVSLGMYPGVLIDGTIGYNYSIQVAPNLFASNSWVTVTNLTLQQTQQLWIDTSINVNNPVNPRRFYRVEAQP